MLETDIILRENVKDALVELRVEHGLSQVEVAKLTGKTRTAVASWEQGLSLPDLATLYRLSKYYQKTMEYFFEHSETQNPTARGAEGSSGIEV